MDNNVQALTEKVKSKSQFVEKIVQEISKVIVGQSYMVERMLLGILCGGHILVEGVPGLAKTTAVKAFAKAIKTSFSRIQFTPDLLPADLIGTQIYLPAQGSFTVKKGPVFSNIILADEINRAPAKVQSALLESMQEKQVTIGDKTFKLEEPFLVMATQNPIEQEGTYPLPEAQVDRFMFKLNISYPTKVEEKEIMNRMSSKIIPSTEEIIDPKDIFEAREIIDEIYMDDKLKDYIVDVVFATREPESYGLDIKHLVQYGASPRATIYLNIASKD